jgi:hypothetical protein
VSWNPGIIQVIPCIALRYLRAAAEYIMAGSSEPLCPQLHQPCIVLAELYDYLLVINFARKPLLRR